MKGKLVKIQYVPLLPVQYGIQSLPRDYSRFQQYLRTVMNAAGTGPELIPLLLANPMGKAHVTVLLDALIALNADGVAAQTVVEASTELVNEPGDFDAGMIVVDDLMGGWTNRYSAEITIRFQSGPPPDILPTWMTRRWLFGALWSSELATKQSIRETMLAAIFRMAYVQRNGLARTLRDKLLQEGQVMLAAGCTAPFLDEDDLNYTREVLIPYLEAEDMPTSISCLFGDVAGSTLGFTPLGLSPWAGLALALHDARSMA